MKVKVEETIVDGEVKYTVMFKNNIFSKWDNATFVNADGSLTKTVTLLQLGAVPDLWPHIPEDIRKKIRVEENKLEIKDHCENRYHIGMWVNPEYSRQIKQLCGAKEIGDLSDGYHTFNELYDFRREYNAALVNTGVWKAHKSHRHHDGELCFGGGWFIVMIDTPQGQISNHYEDKYWDEFHCEEKEIADEWDGHTEKDVLERLMKCNAKQ